MEENLLIETKEAFNLFDKDSAGSIRTKDVGLVLSSLGFSLSAKDMAEIEKSADPNNLGYVKYPVFEAQLEKAAALAKASSDEARKAIADLGPALDVLFRNRTGDKVNNTSNNVSDKETISVSDLKHVLTKVGEKISTEEFSDLTRDLDIVNGDQININQLVNFLVI